MMMSLMLQNEDMKYSLPTRWEMYGIFRGKSEYGRRSRYQARMNRNDAYLAAKGKSKPIKHGERS
jgi:hypothetical protein